MGLNLSKFYAFFAFFILIFAGCADERRSAFFTATSRAIIFTWRLALAGGS